MSTAQCITGAVWAACAVDLYASHGLQGVALFGIISAAAGTFLYRHMNRRTRHGNP